MEKSAQKTKWTFNRSQATEKQSFHVGVSFQFVSLGKSNVKTESSLTELFYPFIGARSGAFSALSSSLAIAVGLAALILS